MNQEDYISYRNARGGFDLSISGYLFKKEMTGKRFNRYFPNLLGRLIKLTDETENHNGMQFVTGENKDIKPFSPTTECGGGIYFTYFMDLPLWLNYGGREMKYFRYVSVPLDSRVSIEGIDKFKADKIILSDRREISDYPLWSGVNFAMMAMIMTDRSLKYIEKHSKDFQFQVKFITKFGMNGIKKLLKLNVSISEELQIEVVRKDPTKLRILIEYNKTINASVSEEVQIAALEGDSYSIKVLLQNITVSERVLLTALKHHGLTIGILLDHGINVTEEMQLLAVENDGDSVKYLMGFGHNEPVSEKVMLAAVKNYGKSIRIPLFAKRKSLVTEEMLLVAVKSCKETMFYLLSENVQVSQEVQKAAVREHKKALEYMLDYDNDNDNDNNNSTQLSEEVLLEAARYDGYSIKYLLKKGLSVPEEVQLTAVRQNADVMNLLLRYDVQVSDEVYIAFAEKRG